MNERDINAMLLPEWFPHFVFEWNHDFAFQFLCNAVPFSVTFAMMLREIGRELIACFQSGVFPSARLHRLGGLWPRFDPLDRHCEVKVARLAAMGKPIK